MFVFNCVAPLLLVVSCTVCIFFHACLVVRFFICPFVCSLLPLFICLLSELFVLLLEHMNAAKPPSVCCRIFVIVAVVSCLLRLFKNKRQISVDCLLFACFVARCAVC